MRNKLIFELDKPGSESFEAPAPDTPIRRIEALIPEHLLASSPPDLPQVSELDLMRHYTHLSRQNYGVDTNFYPLGSCTMKYNPKINEKTSRFPGFCEIHPYTHPDDVQGALELMFALDKTLCEITGMDAFTLQPAAGAHGEFTSLLMVKAYFNAQGEEGKKRNRILIPDSAHGTNPASAALGGFETVEIKSDARGNVDLQSLKDALDEHAACLMLTMPNTLGLFDENMLEIEKLVHANGTLMYMDGANLNALMGMAKPAELGFDVMHINLHKTFSTPHGGGGPGAGPVGVISKLEPFLPNPRVSFEDGRFIMKDYPQSIGRVKAFYGNFLVMVRAYTYIMSIGGEGLREAARMAVLNANYMKEKLKGLYELKYDRQCLHEFVLSANRQKEHGVTAKDIGKRLLDYGSYAPTTYFPLIVEEALMIEPTETESKETLDQFISIMITIDEESKNNPEMVKSAPHTTPVKRVDDVAAARKPILKFESKG
jgi:glycine dehydrogenase subunit 2